MSHNSFWKIIDFIKENDTLHFGDIKKLLFKIILEINEETELNYDIDYFEESYLDFIDDIQYHQRIWLVPLIINIIYEIKNSFSRIDISTRLQKIENIDFEKNKGFLLKGICFEDEYFSEEEDLYSEKEDSYIENENYSEDYSDENYSEDNYSENNYEDYDNESFNYIDDYSEKNINFKQKNRINNSIILLTNLSNFNDYVENEKILNDDEFLVIGFMEENITFDKNFENNLKIICKSNKLIKKFDLEYYYFHRIISSNSIMRSISSLLNLNNISFYNDIISPPPYKKLKHNFYSETNKIRRMLRLNRTQSKALIKLLYSRNNFEWVQGPPGTGKTKLLINLIYYILTKNHEKNKFPKILVCSASNNIVDDILQRFIKLLKNKNNKKINVLRLISNFMVKKHKRNKKFTVNDLCDKFDLTEKEIIKDTDVFFSTINYSGSYQGYILKNRIHYWIIDEACQSLEPETLIPFQLNPKKIFLFGDPLQLPPFSLLKDHEYFNRSIFERFMDSDYQEIFINRQYRMLPVLSEFPNNFFYDGKIINHQLRNKYPLLKNRNYLFINYNSTYQQKLKNKSYYNKKEIEIIIDLIIELKEIYPNIKYSVITPYKSQLLEMKEYDFFRNFKEIKTIDSFQGKENEIIIVSLVRTKGYSIGFLKDYKRLNVLMTRAKYGLYFIGKKNFLEKNKFWSSFFDYIGVEGKIINYESYRNNLLGF